MFAIVRDLVRAEQPVDDDIPGVVKVCFMLIGQHGHSLPGRGAIAAANTAALE
jgi:hypothetical protein